MNESAWEVVDAPSANQANQAKPVTPQQFISALFGRWWKWKAAVLIVLASCILIVFATFAGIVVILMACIALFSVSMKKMSRWWRGGQAEPGRTIT